MAINVAAKACGGCKRELPLEAFSRHSGKPDGRQSACRQCKARWRRENAQREAGYKTTYEATPAGRAKRRECLRRWREKLRSEVIAAYGGKCACCGEGRVEFLTIDHIDGRTDEERELKTQQVYVQLRREGFPQERFRLLCWNCNCAHGMYGYCPHERELKAVG